MDRPARFIIEERHAPTEDGGISRTVELRFSFDPDAVSRAASRVVPVAAAVGGRRGRIARCLASGGSALQAKACSVLPVLTPKAAAVSAGVTAGAGFVAHKVVGHVRDSEWRDRASRLTKRLVERFNGKLSGPTCPNCGRETFLRVSKDSGQVFAACAGHDTAGCNFVEFIELKG